MTESTEPSCSPAHAEWNKQQMLLKAFQINYNTTIKAATEQLLKEEGVFLTLVAEHITNELGYQTKYTYCNNQHHIIIDSDTLDEIVKWAIKSCLFATDLKDKICFISERDFILYVKK